MSKSNDVKWYDKRLMIPSLLIMTLLSVIFYTLAMRHKPPEGFVFEREPVITGEYRCCYPSGRHSASWVGNVQLSCRNFDYYAFLGASRDDCGLKEQLNGQTVEVVQAYIPSSGDRSPLSVRITAHGQTYYEVSDQEIRERWIFASSTGAVLLALLLTVIFHAGFHIYLIYFHKPTAPKGTS